MKRIALTLTLLLCAAVARADSLLDIHKAAFGTFSFNGFVAPPPSDPTTGLLPAPNDAYPNWALAGLTKIGGIAANEPTTQCGSTLTPSGGDDVSQTNSAITACPAGQYVLLGAGTFKISGATANNNILINKGVQLRGSGPGITILSQTPGNTTKTYQVSGANCSGCVAFATPVVMMMPVQIINGDLNGSNNWTGCPWTTTCNGPAGTFPLTVDGAQGASTVTVASTSGLSAGMWVRIDENSGATTYTGPLGSSIFAAPDLVANTAAPATGKIAYAGAGVEEGVAYGALHDRETSEIHLIASVTSTTITFDSPLTINYRTSNSAQIYTPSHAFVQKASIENLTITGSVNNPINMMFCAYCWIKNVETSFWIGGVVINNSARAEINQVYFHDCVQCENNGNEYPFAFDGGTTESLFTNSISQLGGKGMVGRACGGGNVTSYNYFDREFYEAGSIGNSWIDMSVNGSHYVGCHHMLLEGNWGNNCDNDNTHGNEVYHTFHRNWCTGLRSDFTDPSFSTATSVTFNTAQQAVSDVSGIGFQNGGSPPFPAAPGQLHPAGAMATDYWMGFVANVLGSPGVTCVTGCTQTGWQYQHNGQQTKTVWMLGWVGGGTNDPNLTGAGGAAVSCNGSNPPGCSYLFRHANYDIVNAGIADYQTGFTHTLVNSFYLSAAPSFFGPGASCTYSWPWVDPQSGTPIKSNSCSGSGLPAKARYDAGTPFVQP